MDENTASNLRTSAFRAAIDRFRSENHCLDNADDALRKADDIQAATHVLKATHPKARQRKDANPGSNLRVRPADLPHRDEIGTHSLSDTYVNDVAVDNAAMLSVCKFLVLEVENRRLLDWFLCDDADLKKALRPEEEKVLQKVACSDARLNSSEKAKQIYWCHSGKPADDSGFHLLEPLFPSALMHAVYGEIHDARFGEKNKAARQAFRERKTHDGSFRQYSRVVAYKIGGAQPQNISQLNSERRGVNYLLASLPPAWDESRFRPLLGVDSVLPRFERRENVRKLLRAMISLLKENPDPTMETRQRRERIEKKLGEELAAFGWEMRQNHPPGWTRDENCKLPLWTQLWLDPERAEMEPREGHEEEDEAFSRDFTREGWLDDVAKNFAYWANGKLREAGLPVGSVELKHWMRSITVETLHD